MNLPRSETPDALHNRLLDALGETACPELARWIPHLEPVELRCGQVLCESGVTPDYAYFPTTAIISLVYLTQDGASAEIAVVGNDGVVGISIFMGGIATPNRAVVQSAGRGYRLRAQAVKDEALCAGPVLKVLLGYAQTLIAQVAQTAACNSQHSLSQRLARWLLLAHDRMDGDELALTQEFLGIMLAVRRAGVTNALGLLQAVAVIDQRRGRVIVRDRPGLEAAACGCYGRVQAFAAVMAARTSGTMDPTDLAA